MILITGHNGFLGQYIDEAFKDDNQQTLGLKTIVKDISSLFKIEQQFERVVHCAGLAHKKAKNDDHMFAVNLQGTVQLCKALESALPEQFVFISTVAVYGLEEGTNVNEQFPLLGSTAYAKSKIEAEAYLSKWCSEKGVKLCILRLPLIVGVNPPGNLGKMLAGLKKGTYHRIGKGRARKSMVLAEDIANLIVEKKNAEGVYNLTDGVHPSFYELERHICKELGLKMPWPLPFWPIWFLSKIGNFIPKWPLNSTLLTKLTKNLIFDDTKAQKELNWSPQQVILNWKFE